MKKITRLGTAAQAAQHLLTTKRPHLRRADLARELAAAVVRAYPTTWRSELWHITLRTIARRAMVRRAAKGGAR